MWKKDRHASFFLKQECNTNKKERAEILKEDVFYLFVFDQEIRMYERLKRLQKNVLFTGVKN